MPDSIISRIDLLLSDEDDDFPRHDAAEWSPSVGWSEPPEPEPDWDDTYDEDHPPPVTLLQPFSRAQFQWRV